MPSAGWAVGAAAGAASVLGASALGASVWGASAWGASGAGAAAGAGAANANAKLEAVTVAYLPRNQAPEVSAVNVFPPSVALQELMTGIDPSILSSGLDPQLFGLSTNLPPRRFFQKGARTITWTASDGNDDSLIYNLFYKTLGDNSWHLLAENLTQNYYTLDGSRLADGDYTFKVVASDSPENPEDVALKSERATDTIAIDNTPPAIRAGAPSTSGNLIEVMFDATETTSRIVKGEYSIDGGLWKLVFPVDGIADSTKESFKVKVTFDKPGEHVIAFRCADASSNVGSSKVTVTR